jgi:hypothetical protein
MKEYLIEKESTLESNRWGDKTFKISSSNLLKELRQLTIKKGFDCDRNDWLRSPKSLTICLNKEIVLVQELGWGAHQIAGGNDKRKWFFGKNPRVPAAQ